VRKKAIWALGLTAVALLASCAPHATQSTLNPAGSTASEEKNLFIPVFWIAVGVFVLVEGGIVYIAIRYRHRKGRDRMPKQTHGNTRLEIGWTIVPALVLAVVMVPTVSLIWKLAAPPPPGSLHVTVEGYQWWWGFQYTDADMQVDYGTTPAPITTADVMVIPAGRTVYLSLESEGGGAHNTDGTPDYVVIHSFWAPRLFGKQDVVPGRTNHITFNAYAPGVFTGQCAEFCGLEHGRMKFRIVALDAADWSAWVADQKTPGDNPDSTLAKEGETLFMNPLSGNRGTCVACHGVGGTAAAGTAAPNLTHFANPNHECFAGCNWDVYNADGSPNTTDLGAWLHDPNAVKMGAKMPDYNLSQSEIKALMAYLFSLK
jgi:cytochrome c oxidase subunit II